MDPATFLAQIVAHPDDDAPRLVLADWYLQRGDPRGELIAVQCTLERRARTDEPVGNVRQLQTRERSLLAAHAAGWAAAARAVAPSWEFGFRRGMIEEARVRHHAVDAVGALREVEPTIRSLHARAFELPPLAEGLTEVVVEDGLFDHLMGALAALASLRRLAFRRVWAPPEGMLALAGLPQPLTALDLGFDGRLATRPPGFVERLAGRPDLEELSIRQLRHLDGRIRALAELPRLRRVGLENADLGPEDLLALAAAPRLESLDVAENYSSFALKPLDTARLLEAAPNLRWLRLSKLGLEDRHAVDLARSPHAARLTRVDLARNEIGDQGGRAIARSEHLRGLRRLNLNANRLSAAVKAEVKAAFPDAEVQVR